MENAAMTKVSSSIQTEAERVTLTPSLPAVSDVVSMAETALTEALESLARKMRLKNAEAVADRLRWIWRRPIRRLRRLVAAAVAAFLIGAAVVSSLGFARARKAQARAEASERTALAAQAEAERRFGIRSQLIMCFLRHLPAADAMATFEMAAPWYGDLIGVGLDSGDPDRCDTFSVERL